jgi:oxygen-independent coproporphyrinogen-3 oxidase
LYEIGKKRLSENGYHEIGMDHFALETDSLYHSFNERKLHRNFMGYTSSKTQVMIGLGVSSISDSWYSFAQNVKTLEDYYDALAQNELPVFRGHLLTDEDLIIRKHILNIMCQLHTSWYEYGYYFSEINQVLDRLHEMEEDGLVIITNHSLTVTEKGKAFIRNICMAFDLCMTRKLPETKLFSMTV